MLTFCFRFGASIVTVWNVSSKTRLRFLACPPPLALLLPKMFRTPPLTFGGVLSGMIALSVVLGLSPP